MLLQIFRKLVGEVLQIVYRYTKQANFWINLIFCFKLIKPTRNVQILTNCLQNF